MNRPKVILAVDLDGTLIGADLLIQSLKASLSRDPLTPFRAARALLQGGRPALKRVLAATGSPSPAALPYKKAVIEYVREWRSGGGRAVLVTAADHMLAEAVAEHVGLFDEVHGTSAGRNLKGATKARFLVERYGKGGFVYVGDSVADLDVWESACAAVTVDASLRLRRRVEALGRPVEHLASGAPERRGR